MREIVNVVNNLLFLVLKLLKRIKIIILEFDAPSILFMSDLDPSYSLGIQINLFYIYMKKDLRYNIALP